MQLKLQGGCADGCCRCEVISFQRRPRSTMWTRVVLVVLLLTSVCFTPSLSQVDSLVQVLPNEDDPICVGSIIIYKCTVTGTLLRWSYTNGGDPVEEVPFHDSDAVSTVRYLGPFKVVLVGNDFINGSSVLTSTASIGNGVMADVNNKSISCEAPQFTGSIKIFFAAPEIMNASFCMCTIYWRPPPCDANCTVSVDGQDVGVVPCSDGNLSVESDLSTKTVNITARDQLGISVVVQAVPAIGTGMPCNVLCLETSEVSPSVTSSTMPDSSTNLALIIGVVVPLLVTCIAIIIMVVVVLVRIVKSSKRLILDQKPKVFTVATSPITHCKIAPGAASVAIADSSGCVRVLKCDTGAIDNEYMSTSSVVSLQWLEYEGHNLLMFANQTHMQIFDVENKRRRVNFKFRGFCDGSRVICLAHCATRLVFALSCLLPTEESDGDDTGQVIIDDHGEGKDNMMCSVKVTSPVSCVVFNYRGTQVITGNIEGEITVFSVQNEESKYTAIVVCNLLTHHGIVYNLQYSYDQGYVYSIGKNDSFLLKSKLSKIHNLTKTMSSKINAGAVSTVQVADETFCVCGQFFCLMPREEYVLTSSNAQGIVYKVRSWGNAAVKLNFPPLDANITCVDWRSREGVNFTCVFGCADNSLHVMNVIKKSD